METKKLKWTAEDDKDVREYKKQVRSGKVHPIRYTGNLRELIENS